MATASRRDRARTLARTRAQHPHLQLLLVLLGWQREPLDEESRPHEEDSESTTANAATLLEVVEDVLRGTETNAHMQ